MPRKKHQHERKQISRAEFARRRKELAALMDEDSIAIVPGGTMRHMNWDKRYRFRQDADFFYLTGFDEPDGVFVLIPGREHGESILFCRERDAEVSRWHGDITGPERARQLFGMDDAFPISDINDILPGLIEGRTKLYYAMGLDSEFDSQVNEWVRKINRRGHLPPGELVQLEHLLHELRLYKSAGEIELMRLAAEATSRGHCRIMARVTPGMMEYELEAELNHEFAMGGARWPAYPAIVGGGSNACVLHYLDNDEPLRDGDLVLVDAGGEYQNYACDLTRTFPVNGKFTKTQEAVYNIVLEAQLAAIDQVKPGNTWNDPHDAAMRKLTEGLVQLGILAGDVDMLMNEQAHLPYCTSRTGHWLGMDVHDVGDYQVNGEWRVFEPGMVTTIEPGLYFTDDMVEVPKKYRGMGVRIEDDVLVTKTGNEVLTAGVPNDIEGIESLMQDGRVANG